MLSYLKTCLVGRKKGMMQINKNVEGKIMNIFLSINLPGRVAQLVTCLTADTGVASLIPVLSHTLVEIDYEIISTTILLPSADSRKVVVIYK